MLLLTSVTMVELLNIPVTGTLILVEFLAQGLKDRQCLHYKLVLLAEMQCGQAAGGSWCQRKEWVLYCKDSLGAWKGLHALIYLNGHILFNCGGCVCVYMCATVYGVGGSEVKCGSP